VSELRSAIEALGPEILAELPDARLEEDFAELQRAAELLEIERLRRLAEIDRRRVFARDGNLSAASWLVDRFRMAWGAAKESVRVARSLDAMPGVVAALEDGAVSMSAVRILAEAYDAEPEAFAEAEAFLVDAAGTFSVADLRRVATHWRQVVERARGLDPLVALRARRRLHASVTLDGSVRVDGDLDPENGETLLTALRAVLDDEARSGRADDRSPVQRRADALGEICRQWLDRGERPEVAGERPHLTMTMGIEALRRDGPAELEHVGSVAAATARRLACDASITRVVMSGRSEPLDVGRRTPVISPALRRAVVVRDRCCLFPGCDRPQSWCDAHHVVHWADGGPTALANLVLLCRRHHRSVHDGFSVELGEDRPVFRRPDGSPLEDRGPP
jgi:hypothetical protein